MILNIIILAFLAILLITCALTLVYALGKAEVKPNIPSLLSVIYFVFLSYALAYLFFDELEEYRDSIHQEEIKIQSMENELDSLRNEIIIINQNK
jgi:Kef-type K+ transport system membrane component KefB